MRVLNPSLGLRLAIDAGTAVTRACTTSSQVLEAESSIRDYPGEGTARRAALRGGVVCDIAAAARVIRPLVRSLAIRGAGTGAIVSLPTDATAAEREALVEAVTEAGATVGALVPEPLAAAVGAGIDATSPSASLIADLGDGVCDVALIREGTIVSSRALRTGCSDARRAVIDWLGWQRDLRVDSDVAERVVRTFCRNGSKASFEITGKNARSGTRTEKVSRDELAVLIEPVADALAAFIASAFHDLRNEDAASVIGAGVHLTGGGALLALFVRRIEKALGIRAAVAPDPLWAVIAGAREMLGQPTMLSRAMEPEAVSY